MEKRKTIALVTSCPEEEYQQRVFKGVFEQCEKYGYNLAVFAMNVQTWHYFDNYLEGDENLYNLINYSKFDGVIVTPITLSHNNSSPLVMRVLDKITLEATGKVVALDLPFGDFESVYTDDTAAIKRITNHLIKEHGCKDIICLTGYDHVEVSHQRLDGYKAALAENDILVDDSRIIFGDFWYNSGNKLAEDIKSGAISKPDAIVCANDHMAIGVIEKLKDSQYRIPEDIIITGFDATREAYLYDMSLTTYIPEVSYTGAEAVNIIRKAIEPEKPVFDISKDSKKNLILGESCGCKSNISDIKKSLKGFIYHMNQGVSMVDKNDTNDIIRLNESYMFETLISQYTIKQVLSNIDIFTYLIKPFDDFYLCLREDFDNLDISCQKGYPDRMKMVIHRNVLHESDSRIDPCFSGDDLVGERSFNTEEMLPELFEPSEKPSVFYFSPVHFNRETFGYAVLRCDLLEEHRIGSVYRNWIRNIGNALEMIRVKTRLIDESVEDKLTGLLNRRGMDAKLTEIKRYTSKSNVYVIMVDMDRLKYINDNFGHEEGDFGIKTIAEAMKNNTRKEEICVRSGGDEFLVVGFTDDCDKEIEGIIERIRESIKKASETYNKPYEISASFGYSVKLSREAGNIDGMIKEADEKMYIEKRAKHAERK